ncbi:penicillin-insensitive murein endopeptidase [Salmonella enterica subsp. enterica serovar Weltevreden]|nr:penicillin-insensitive murein endopeptidase [Salmonella enterica subsp. enterica serovar Weltevreden]
MGYFLAVAENARERVLRQALDLVSHGAVNMSSRWSSGYRQSDQTGGTKTASMRVFSPSIRLLNNSFACADAEAIVTQLRKVRPWFQHRAHMHVRVLRCPADGARVRRSTFTPIPGDGCGAERKSWFEPPQNTAFPKA